MPIYEYLCCNCQYEFQLTRSVDQAEKPAFCPCCGREGKKLISEFASTSDSYIRVPEKAALRRYAAVCGSGA